MAQFSVSQTVYRREDRVDVSAIVQEVNVDDDGKTTYLIDYVEGGTGWWPETALTAQAPA